MNDDIAKRDEFSDENDFSIPLNEMLMMRRKFQDEEVVGGVITNVPHLVVQHSPSGFEWGYGGSGPADLALNVCQWYLIHIGYRGEKSQCYDGNCFSLAFVLHQRFKSEFIATAPREGITIPIERIAEWFDEHVTDELKSMYAVIEEELE